MKHFLSALLVLILSNSFLSAQHEMPAYTVESFRTGQPGETADNCIDGNIETTYHSLWNENGIPDKLTFIFSNRVPSINKIEYTPRTSGLNGVWTKVTIYYTTKADPETWIKVTQDALTWPLDNEIKTVELPEKIVLLHSIIFTISEAGGNFSSCAEMKFYSDDELLPDGSIDCPINTAEFVIGQDQKISITQAGSFASTFQSGENIEKCFDGDLSTLYHSKYNGGTAIFPVELNFHFEANETIDYFKYIPRSDGGGNGNFGVVLVSFNTSDEAPGNVYSEFMSFNFLQNGLPTYVHFPFSINPRNIKITVYYGGGNFVSCAEMEFYKSSGGNSTALLYPDIFSNSIYSTLWPAVSQEMIDTMGSVFYKELAQCLFDGSYNLKYRAQEYLPYPTINKTAGELKVGTYDRFENMTGIVFSDEQQITLFVEDLHDEGVYLRVRDFHNEAAPTDDSYQLKEGLNIINILHKGLSYISYYTNQPLAAPIKINIVSGLINGYFDINTSTIEDWIELMTNNAYPKVDIRGYYTHLVYDRLPVRANTPYDGLSFIGRYDTIVKHERILMGLFKFNRSPSNRQFAWTESAGGWYAGGLGAHFDLSWGTEGITSIKDLGLWGVAHEFGHINQIRPGLKWIGTTEVTNNIYSLWVYYHMNRVGEKYTRLESEPIPANEGDEAITGGEFNGFIDATYVGKKQLQTFTSNYPFKVLIPFWQLELYYQLAGASRGAAALTLEENPPVTGIDYAHWYGIVAEKVRTSTQTGLTNGEHLINFVKYTCEAVEEDLTDFFKQTGFLTPIDIEIDDYGIGQLTVTQEQIDEVVAYVKSKGYNAPVSPVINYITAHSINIYKDKLPLSGINGEGYTISGQTMLIDPEQWLNAVAFETFNEADELIHVTTYGTGDLVSKSTTIQFPDETVEVYAVGYDGSKILVYPKVISAVNKGEVASFLISPNPVDDKTPVSFMADRTEGKYQMKVYSSGGHLLLNSIGDMDQLESQFNVKLTGATAGSYFVKVKNVLNGRMYQGKLVKQ